ncbi:hypothetical protein TNCV_4829391 [Trichonephila clavipes]|nr:hypothetical protein TNCV_4829391 [Trichonephila clavipes]
MKVPPMKWLPFLRTCHVYKGLVASMQPKETDIEDYLELLEGGWLSEEGLDGENSDEYPDADGIRAIRIIIVFLTIIWNKNDAKRLRYRTLPQKDRHLTEKKLYDDSRPYRVLSCVNTILEPV